MYFVNALLAFVFSFMVFILNLFDWRIKKNRKALGWISYFTPSSSSVAPNVFSNENICNCFFFFSITVGDFCKMQKVGLRYNWSEFWPGVRVQMHWSEQQWFWTKFSRQPTDLRHYIVWPKVWQRKLRVRKQQLLKSLLPDHRRWLHVATDTIKPGSQTLGYIPKQEVNPSAWIEGMYTTK